MKNINDLISENKQSRGDADGSDKIGNVESEADNQHLDLLDTGKALDIKMQEMKQKEMDEQLKNKAQQMGFGFVDLKGIPVPSDVLQRIPLQEVKEKKVVCFYYAPHKTARLATLKTLAEEISALQKEFEERLKIPVEMFLTSENSFAEVLKQYEAAPKIKKTTGGVEIEPDDLEKFSNKLSSLEEVANLISSASTTELVAVVVAAGLKTNSSDIHIEAEVDGIKLRYRIDGVLHTAAVLEKSIWQNLISRLKLLSGLKLNIEARPQDGRFSIQTTDDKIDVRVSTLPTAYGESVVLRLLLSKMANLKMGDLGLNQQAFEMLQRQIKRPNGMIITTGPTGSGKTTTLYGVLNKLNDSETKIITIEDPIEYEVKGVNQSQINESKEYTFAKGLRSIVRQDPDIILVGEMRDLETVDIALNAALTGHLVLSTLHTNDAAGAIPRFLAMGAKPYLLAPALNLIVAQRLVRKLCEKCKEKIELDDNAKDKINNILQSLDESGIRNQKLEIRDLNDVNFYKAVGCEECNKLGYNGRIGVFEMFEMSKEIEEIILSSEVSEYKIRGIAQKNGMITMAQDGILKAMQGITSLEEVFRVVG
ncbi:GspE/PulE family protein [Candidatus Parcubacteria bacterium]|nr:GspE/PulE family protein [Patescibacteria group bacterium]MCG2686978.1 GspE/PulE family protein [Candidatus Parcubacteria bacterium]